LEHDRILPQNRRAHRLSHRATADTYGSQTRLAERNSPQIPKDIPISLLIGSFFYFSHSHAHFMNSPEHSVRVDGRASVFYIHPSLASGKLSKLSLQLVDPDFVKSR